MLQRKVSTPFQHIAENSEMEITNLHILMPAVTHQGRRRCQVPRAESSALRASNDAGSGAIRLSFRSPYLDVTGQTMSDRSDSHFIQRPSSTVAASGVHEKRTVGYSAFYQEDFFYSLVMPTELLDPPRR